MACTTLEEIIKGCENNLGGIYNLWVTDQDNVTGLTVDEANWEITAIARTDAFVKVEFNRYIGNYTEDEQNSNENGSTVVTQTINLPLLRRDGAKSRALKIMSEGQRYLSIIVEDGNGIYWYFPYMQITSIGEGSGTAKADGSKYAVVWTATNDKLAYTVDPALIPALLTPQS
jgi:hypothetical protein